MSTDGDLIKLYSQQILALAADIPLTDGLEQPDSSAKKRSPLCGSTVQVDIAMKAGQISAYGQDVKACALGQAAASVVGGAIIGCSAAQVKTARDQLLAMLKTDGPEPDAPFDGLKVLLPARAYKNRHASILLTLDAAVEALDSIDPAQHSQSS